MVELPSGGLYSAESGISSQTGIWDIEESDGITNHNVSQFQLDILIGCAFEIMHLFLSAFLMG